MDGCREVFVRAGHSWEWIGQGEAIIEKFDRYKPDLFFGATYLIDRATLKACKAHPETLVVMKANNWGDSDKEINPKLYPIGIADENEKKNTLELMPSLVFNFYHKNRMDWTMGSWDSHGIPTFPLLPAANHFKYKKVDPNPALACDIGFVGGYWKYKAENLDKYMVPLCSPVGRYNIKIFGNQHWPVPQYMGETNDETVVQLFSSAKICPNISEPHANVFGFEVNERVFKLASSKAFCISDDIASLREDIFTNNELVIAKTPEHFGELVQLYTKAPELRNAHIQKCYDTVMKEHTYVHRMSDMLQALNLNKEAEELRKLL